MGTDGEYIRSVTLGCGYRIWAKWGISKKIVNTRLWLQIMGRDGEYIKRSLTQGLGFMGNI